MNRLNAVLKNIADKKAVLFIGAGVSSIAGCYNWDQIIEAFKKHPVLKSSDVDEEIFKSSTLKHDQLIDYFEDLFAKENREKEFWDILCEAITEEADKFQIKYTPLVRKMQEIQPFPKIVTTNIDDCLERAGQFKPKHIFWGESDLIIANFKEGVIFHIHGYKLDFKAALWTRKKYITRYNDQGFKDLLMEIFTNNSVVFLGCKLGEDSLTNIIRESKIKNPKNEHFALIPTDGKEILDAESSPYKALFGINVIHYGKKEEFCSMFSKWVEDNFARVEIKGSSEGADTAHA